jgi:hypothetical protein
VSLALGTAAIILVVLLWDLTRPKLNGAVARLRLRWSHRLRANAPSAYDPGRELRAEQRARALLRSCIDDNDWAMYRDLGFLRVWGRLGEGGTPRPDNSAPSAPGGATRAGGAATEPEVRAPRVGGEGAPYAYLIYPHKPIVAYLPATGELLNEYCVAFPDGSRPYGSTRLPDSDDVLAKWMALTGDERRLLGDANMHLPGRQVDPDRVRRDLARLAQWERERSAGRIERSAGRAERSPSRVQRGHGPAGSVRAA